MLQLLMDENMHGGVIRGLRRQAPALDVIDVHEAGLAGFDDPSILQWAAQNGRLTLTRDIATFPAFAAVRVQNGIPMPGVIVCQPNAPLGKVIEDIITICEASEPEEWVDQIVYLPL